MKQSLLSQLSFGAASRTKTSKTSSSRHFFIHGREVGSELPFAVAFNMAVEAGERGETPLVITRRQKCYKGKLPPIISACDEEARLKQQQPQVGVGGGIWDINGLSNVKVKYVDSREELTYFLSTLHKWKSDMPTFVVLDELSSLFSACDDGGGAVTSYLSELLGITCHIRNAMLTLRNEVNGELRSASSVKHMKGGDAHANSSSNASIYRRQQEQEQEHSTFEGSMLSLDLMEILKKNATMQSSDIALVVSETSQDMHFVDHIKGELRLNIHVDISIVERNNDLQVKEADVRVSNSRHSKPQSSDAIGGHAASSVFHLRLEREPQVTTEVRRFSLRSDD
jgi:hypothetical protein